MPSQLDPSKRQCSLLLFVATPAEEEGLAAAARARGLPFEKINDPLLGEEFHWLGAIGNEPGVIAIRPIRKEGRVVMGSIGRLGTAARGIQFKQATGAQSIVQIGMAFGTDPLHQKPGDVLVSNSLIPYDNREIRPTRRSLLRNLFIRSDSYIVDYSPARRESARPELIDLFRREQERGGHPFGVQIGAILSGAARIRSARFRDELVAGAPPGEDAIIGGEMEGVGLLTASTAADDPAWCVVKGIVDFADENRDKMIDEFRSRACRNSADLVLSALVNSTPG